MECLGCAVFQSRLKYFFKPKKLRKSFMDYEERFLMVWHEGMGPRAEEDGTIPPPPPSNIQ
jgi:hypothetical protein